MALEFSDIILTGGKTRKRGNLQLLGSSPADAKFSFTSKAPKPLEVNLSECQDVIWMEVGKNVADGGYVLKLSLASRSYIKLSGFQASAFNPIQSWLLNCSKTLNVEKPSTRGANWGKFKVSDQRISFEDKEGHIIFDHPTQTVSQTIYQGKNDVSQTMRHIRRAIAIEFQVEDDPKTLMGQLETLCEMRIYVPNDEREAELAAQAAEKDSAMKTEDEQKAEGEDGKEGEEEEPQEDENAAQLLAKDIMSRVGGDDRAILPIAKFNVMFQSPRGRYQIDMYEAYMKLASKTFQYKVLYKYIHQMYLFEHKGNQQFYFVIGLNPPIRQGRTAHPYLLIQFDGSQPVEEKINLDEKTCLEKYKGVISPILHDHMAANMTRVFKALTDRKVLVPGQNYQSQSDTELGIKAENCVRCNLKANDGYLYVMEKSFFFIKKPLIHIRHVDIAELSFERLASSSTGSKSFDLRIVTNEEKNNEYVFSGIAKTEYDNLFNFLKDKKLNMVTTGSASMATGFSGRERKQTNYDEDHDPHMARIQAEAGSDSEEDSDFEGAESSSSSSESGSDVAAEASDSELDEAPKKKKSRKAASSDEDGGDEDGEKKKGGTKRKRGATDEPPKKRRAAAKSAYFHYLDYARPKYYAAHPDSKETAIAVTSILAAQWRELSPEEKAPFNELAEKSKAELAAKRAEGGEEDEPKPKKKRASKKLAGQPTKPPGAQKIFTDKRKKEIKFEEPSISAPDLKTRLADEWKALSEEDRQEYVEKHLALKKAYKADMDTWEAKHKGEKGDDDAMEDVEDGAGGSGDEDEAKSAKKAKKKDKSKDKSSKKDETPEERKARKEAKKAAKAARKEAKKSKKSKKNKGGDESAGSGDEEMPQADEDETQVKEEPVAMED